VVAKHFEWFEAALLTGERWAEIAAVVSQHMSEAKGGALATLCRKAIA
jgi:hypothetical protein